MQWETWRCLQPQFRKAMILAGVGHCFKDKENIVHLMRISLLDGEEKLCSQ